MKQRVLILICGLVSLGIAMDVTAATQCKGILDQNQQQGFAKMFAPERNAGLSHMGGQLNLDNMSKVLTAADVKRLDRPQPVVLASNQLGAANAGVLVKWLDANAQSTVPGWVSTVAGFVPSAWVGLTADVFLQTLDGAGEAGRLAAAKVAGRVTERGQVVALERVAKGTDGKQKYIFSFALSTDLDGKRVITPLHSCVADIVVK